VLGGDEKDGIRRPNPLAERRPFCRRIVIGVLVVDRQLANLDDAQLQPGRRQFGERVGYLAIDRTLPEAADDHGDVAGLVHADSLSMF
jgi:hypothetical protein